MKRFWIFDPSTWLRTGFGFWIINRRSVGIVCILPVVFLALCSPAGSQQQKKLWRIGYISSSDRARDATRSAEIRRALRELGYIEGQNIAFEYRYGDGKMARLPELASDLVRLKIDLIIAAGGDGVIRPIRNTTKTIPIVMAGQGSDPVEAGFAESLARPGGNVTGLTNLLISLGDKRLELLKEAVPKITRIVVFYVPGNRTHGLELKEIETAAPALGLAVQPWEVRSVVDFDRVFTAMGKQRPDGLQMLGGPVMRDNEKRIVDFALKSRLPSVFTSAEAVNIGGLMYYGANLIDSYRRVATYVDRILKGASAAELPIQQPSKFELLIDLKTAKQIGVTIQPNVLARADRVIR
jgi:putative ABC transport system substrate-binding protein